MQPKAPSKNVKKDDPQAKTDASEPVEQKPQDAVEAGEAEDREPVDGAEATDEATKAEEPEADGKQEVDGQPDESEEDAGVQMGIQIFIQPGPILMTQAGQMDAIAPVMQQVDQVGATEQSAQAIVTTEMPPVAEQTAPGQQIAETPLVTEEAATQAEQPVLEMEPELAQKVAAVTEEQPRTSKAEATHQQTHEAGTTDKAEAFAAQVVSEARDMVQEQGAQPTGAPQAEEGQELVDAVLDEDSTDAEQDPSSKKESGTAGRTEHTQLNTAQVADNGRVDFRLSGAQPLEAQQNVPQEVREFNIQRVVDQVRTEITPDKTEFYIQLKPDHLGGLSIALVSEDKGVVAKLMTSSQQVHNALQADMNQMLQMLRDKGINVVQMEVIYDQMANSMTNRDTNQQQQGQSGRGSGGRTHGRVGEVAEDAMSMYDTLSSYEVLTEQGGSVEYTA